jgi:beta-galactosidase
LIHPSGTETLASYQCNYFAGTPAVTVQRYGEGSSYCLGTNLSAEGLAGLLDFVCLEAGVRPVLNAPQGVEVTRRTDGEHSWLFILNHLEEEQQVDLQGKGVNIISGEDVNGDMRIEPKGVAIIQLSS